MRDLIKVWRHNTIDGRVSLRLYDLGKRDEWGKWILGYRLSSNRKVLFSGEDYHCAPSSGIDSIETVYDLLGFLTLKPGDTDDEYFKDYTPEQIEWCQSDQCGDLAYFVMEQEEKRDKRR